MLSVNVFVQVYNIYIYIYIYPVGDRTQKSGTVPRKRGPYFTGNIFVGKIEQSSQYCLILLNINILFTELLYKIAFALVFFAIKTALV